MTHVLHIPDESVGTFRNADDRPDTSTHTTRKQQPIMRISPTTLPALSATFALIIASCGSSKSTPQDLGEAVQASDYERVQAILADGVSPNITGEMGLTPLIVAIMKDHSRMVDILLEAGADPNVAMRMGMTPLHHAIVKDLKQIVFLLLDAGADPNTRDGFDAPAILYAVSGDGTILRRLIEAGADVNGTDGKGNTALHAIAMVDAARESNITILLEAGADPSLRDENGKTALELAREEGREEVVELLGG